MAHRRRHEGKVERPPKIRGEASVMFSLRNQETCDKIRAGQSLHVKSTYRCRAANFPNVPDFDMPEFDVKFDELGNLLAVPQLYNGTYKQVVFYDEHDDFRAITRDENGQYKLQSLPDYALFESLGKDFSKEKLLDYCKNSDDLIPGRQRSTDPDKAGFMARVGMDRSGTKTLSFDADHLFGKRDYYTNAYMYAKSITDEHDFGDLVFVERDASSSCKIYCRDRRDIVELDDVKFGDLADKVNDFQDKHGYVTLRCDRPQYSNVTGYGTVVHDSKGRPCVEFKCLDKDDSITHEYTCRLYESELGMRGTRYGSPIRDAPSGAKMRVELPYDTQVKGYVNDELNGRYITHMPFGQIVTDSKAYYFANLKKQQRAQSETITPSNEVDDAGLDV